MHLAVEVDVIVLAQASMARVLATLEPGALSVPVLSGMAGLASVVASLAANSRSPLRRLREGSTSTSHV